VKSGDGDGTVNRRGLEAALTAKWASADHEAFSGENHSGLLKSSKLIAELLAIAGVPA
jgi:hypothetical protein